MTASSLSRIKCGLVLLVFMLFSVSPIPITSAIGLWVVIFRPRWFKQLVDRVYADIDG
jgi:hypothetical protein